MLSGISLLSKCDKLRHIHNNAFMRNKITNRKILGLKIINTELYWLYQYLMLKSQQHYNVKA